MPSTTPPEKMRIDKWLWCARFFKTRSLAAQAVEGGRVQVNAARVKPARHIARGDRLSIQIGELTWKIEVLGLSAQRSAAHIAQSLYLEDADSVARREQQIIAHPNATNLDGRPKGRPTKRDRRQIHRFIKS